MIFLVSIVILSLIEYVGDSSLKEYLKNTTKLNKLIIGIAAYIVVVKLLIEAFKNSNVIFTNTIWDAVSIIVETILAVLILHQTLNNVYQWVGLFIIIIGIIFLNIGKRPN